MTSPPAEADIPAQATRNSKHFQVICSKLLHN